MIRPAGPADLRGLQDLLLLAGSGGFRASLPAAGGHPGGLLDALPDAPMQDTAILQAARAAAVYRTHALVRHGCVPRGAAAVEALQQRARELVRGHRRAGRALDAVNG